MLFRKSALRNHRNESPQPSPPSSSPFPAKHRTPTSALAHEFNNFLAAILGQTELALLKLPENSPIRADLAHISDICLKAGERCQQVARASETPATSPPYDTPGPKPPANPISDPIAPQEAVSSPRGILVVDDEVGIRTLSEMVLKRAGHTVFTAENGSTALTLFAENRPNIHLILLDLAMPDMDGPELLKAIRRIDPSIPIIIMSGYGSDEITRLFGPADSTGFIQKPFHFPDLLLKIEQALHG